VDPQAALELILVVAGRESALIDRGNAESFLADTLKAYALNPKTGNARLNLGLAHLYSGNDAEALTAYQSVCSENPTKAELAEMRSDLDSALKVWLTPERARPIQEVLDAAQPSS
jgi:tetratricopeptide (TPR) repeat protein